MYCCELNLWQSSVDMPNKKYTIKKKEETHISGSGRLVTSYAVKLMVKLMDDPHLSFYRLRFQMHSTGSEVYSKQNNNGASYVVGTFI